MASIRSRVCRAQASNAAWLISASPASRVRPKIAPREAGEGGRQHHAVVLACGHRQRLDRLRPAGDAELFVDPLDRRPGDEDRALQRIGRPPVHPRRHGGEQPGAGHRRRLPGVDQHETAGAVGGLHLARPDAPLAHQRRLLVAGHAADGDRAAQDLGVRLAEFSRTIENLRQDIQGNIQQLAHFRRPFLAADVEDQGARGVGRVGGVDAPAGQLPDHPAVDGPRQQLAGLGRRPGARHMVQQPGDLGAGEVGIEQQSGDLGHPPLVAALAQPLAGVGRTPVLPDHGLVDRLAARLVPDHHRLALVGDADGGHLLHAPAGFLDRLAQHGDTGLVDLLGVMLDPAVVRIGLRQRSPRLGQRLALGVEQDGAGAGGALVEREQQRFGHAGSP
jgi:hypothetical protein